MINSHNLVVSNEDAAAKRLNMLGALAIAVADRIAAAAETKSGLGGSAGSALVVLANRPGEPVEPLRRALGLTHSGGVRLVDALEALGLVERRRNERDARAVALWLTDKGTARAREIMRARADLLTPILAEISEAQHEMLTAMLEVALGRLTDNEIDARLTCRFCDEGVCRPQGCPVELAVRKATPDN